MALRILGPLDLVPAQGAPSIRVGGPRERTVLAALALRANYVVPRDHLVDAVWDEDPPATARGQIQGCVSALRKVLTRVGPNPPTIETRHDGYRLLITDDTFDVAVFRGLLEQAREVSATDPQRGCEHYRAALEQWRGDALQDVPSPALRPYAATLDENRADAAEEMLRLEVHLGRAAHVLPDLRAFVAVHPLRESGYETLMHALYSAGHVADSLEVMRAAQHTLDEQLGIRPGARLQELQTQILNHDPVLSSTAPGPDATKPDQAPDRRAGEDSTTAQDGKPGSLPPRQLPRSAPDFVGRARAVQEISALLSADAASAAHAPTPIVGIHGVGGIGKSTLALHVAQEAAQHYPDGQLYLDVSTTGEEGTGLLLGQLLRSFGLSGPALPEDRDDRARLYRSHIANRRMLLVLDGVSDERQVLPLIPGTSTCAVIIAARARLDYLAGAHWFGLEVFSDEESVEMLAHTVGRERLEREPDECRRLIEYAGGLPLALRIAGARLASRSHWRLAELTRRMKNERRRLDEFSHRGLELRSSIGTSYRSLPDTAKSMFRLISSLPLPDFSAWAAAALVDTSEPEAEHVLEQLVDVRLLDTFEGPQQQIRYRMHDLIRVYAHELRGQQDSATRQAESFGRLLGAWLDRLDRAHRAEFGGDYTLVHGSSPRHVVPDADDSALDDDPIGWMESWQEQAVGLVRQCSEAGLDEACWDLSGTLVSLFQVRALYDHWRECAEVSLEVTTRHGNVRGQAASAYNLGGLALTLKQLPEAERYLTRAHRLFTESGDQHGAALVQHEIGLVHRFSGHGEHAVLTALQSSLDGLRASGDVVGEAMVLRSLARRALEQRDTAAAAQLLDDALRLCQDAPCRRGVAQVEARMAELHVLNGDMASARGLLESVLRTVRDVGDRVGETHVLLGLANTLREMHDPEAATFYREVVSMAGRAGAKVMLGQALLGLGQQRLAEGDPDGVTDVEAAVDIFTEVPSPRWLEQARAALHDLERQPDMRSSAP